MKTLIVDGYNVIRAAARYSEVAENDLDAARALLVADVAAFSQGSHEATVVFDGARNPTSDGLPHDVAGVAVIFSPHGKDADSVIEALCAERRSEGGDVYVVTSDSETQWVVLGHGATRISSAQFVQEVGDGVADMAEHNPAGTRRATLDARIDPETRDVLARWARGES